MIKRCQFILFGTQRCYRTSLFKNCIVASWERSKHDVVPVGRGNSPHCQIIHGDDSREIADNAIISFSMLARSLHLSDCNYFLWGYLNSSVYTDKLNVTVREESIVGKKSARQTTGSAWQLMEDVLLDSEWHKVTLLNGIISAVITKQ